MTPPGGTWSTPDHHVPIDDARLVADALKAASPVDALLAGPIHDRLRLMRLWADGTARASSTDPGGGTQPMWCDRHGRDMRSCADERTPCVGTPYMPGRDPVGEAAAARANGHRPKEEADRARLLGLLARRAEIDRQIVECVGPYEMRHGRSSTSAVATEWCPSCLRDGGYCEPPATKTDGKLRYKGGLCRWCGGFRSEYGIEPPLPVLRDRHEGRKVTERSIKLALRQVHSPRVRR